MILGHVQFAPGIRLQWQEPVRTRLKRRKIIYFFSVWLTILLSIVKKKKIKIYDAMSSNYCKRGWQNSDFVVNLWFIIQMQLSPNENQVVNTKKLNLDLTFSCKLHIPDKTTRLFLILWAGL